MKLHYVLGALALTASGLAHSASYSWNSWNSASTGTIGAVGVTYTGDGVYQGDVPNWAAKPSTWQDGTVVTSAPTGGIIHMTGGNDDVNKITFSQAVVNPVFTIWSLGQNGDTASYNFIGATPVFLAGGPSLEYNGSAISVVGNNVYGTEGNGSVEFVGTYTSISWTNPKYENWYGFNVGIAGVSAVPEPGSMSLMLAGLGLVGLVVRRRQSR